MDRAVKTLLLILLGCALGYGWAYRAYHDTHDREMQELRKQVRNERAMVQFKGDVKRGKQPSRAIPVQDGVR
jgi:hypothetical protein